MPCLSIRIKLRTWPVVTSTCKTTPQQRLKHEVQPFMNVERGIRAKKFAKLCQNETPLFKLMRMATMLREVSETMMQANSS